MIDPARQLPPAPAEIELTHALAWIAICPPIERAIWFAFMNLRNDPFFRYKTIGPEITAGPGVKYSFNGKPR